MSFWENWDIEDWVLYPLVFLIITGGIIFVISFIFLGIFINDIGSSSGQHTGIITAIETNQGILWSSTLVYFKTDTQTTQENIYCVNNLQLKEKLEKLSTQKKIVTIQYQNPLITWNEQCAGGESIITGVTE